MGLCLYIDWVVCVDIRESWKPQGCVECVCPGKSVEMMSQKIMIPL